jgi:hypothetical protein
MMDWSILNNQDTLYFGFKVLGFGAAVLGFGAGVICKLDGDKIPPPRTIQTLVQAWRAGMVEEAINPLTPGRKSTSHASEKLDRR